MSGTIFNSHAFGSYDFVTQIIEIHNSREQVLKAINTNSFIELNDTELKVYQTYIHEITHLLDSTTTLWGIEYIIRLYQWFKYQDKKSLAALAINDSEVTIHNINPEDKFKKAIYIKYSLEYDGDIGSSIQIHYFDCSGKIITSKPISILSLLENHAYAKELLISIEKYKSQKKFIDLTITERDIKENILDIKSCEYKIYLALSLQVMPDLDIETHLRILCKVFEFCLDLPSTYLIQTPNYLFKMAFGDSKEELISQLKMEFGRGQNRHILAFLILFYILNEIHNKKIDTSKDFYEKLELYIIEIYNINKNNSKIFDSIAGHWEIEMNLNIKLLEELDAQLPLLMAKQRIDIGWGEKKYQDYYLPDVMTDDITYASFKNRLNFDIEHHYNNLYTKYQQLKNTLSEYGARRDHLSPNFAHEWLKFIKENPQGGIFYQQ